MNSEMFYQVTVFQFGVISSTPPSEQPDSGFTRLSGSLHIKRLRLILLHVQRTEPGGRHGSEDKVRLRGTSAEVSSLWRNVCLCVCEQVSERNVFTVIVNYNICVQRRKFWVCVLRLLSRRFISSEHF